MDRNKKSGRRDGNKSFGGDRGFGGNRVGSFGSNRNGGGRPTMHKVDCSECGNVAEVPFRPTGDKPVFCNNCFGGKRESESKRFDSRFDKKPIGNPGPSYSKNVVESKPDPRISEMKMQIDALHSKMDRVIEMMKKEVTKVLDVAPKLKSPKPEPAPVSKKIVVKKVATAKKVVTKKAVVKKTVAKKTAKK